LDAKIADLGQAKALEKLSKAQEMSTAPGNQFYMALEAIVHEPTYDSKLDIFSFGCTVIYLVTEKFPRPTDQYVKLHDTETFKQVSKADRRQEFLNLMVGITLLCQTLIDRLPTTTGT